MHAPESKIAKSTKIKPIMNIIPAIDVVTTSKLLGSKIIEAKISIEPIIELVYFSYDNIVLCGAYENYTTKASMFMCQVINIITWQLH
jgi:hypothetical protein